MSDSIYVPRHFENRDPEVFRWLVREYSFGTMITVSDSDLKVTHLPCLLDDSRGAHGTIRAHVARANDHWKFFDSPRETVIIFQGPHTYVSPTWYTEVFSVPTWNYAVAHAQGRPETLDEDRSHELLMDMVRYFEGPDSTYDYEEGGAYARKSLPGIVAFEMPISKLVVKLKMSQNKTEGDRLRVIERLSEAEDEQSRNVARFMKRLAEASD